jgi:hypothetical protein
MTPKLTQNYILVIDGTTNTLLCNPLFKNFNLPSDLHQSARRAISQTFTLYAFQDLLGIFPKRLPHPNPFSVVLSTRNILSPNGFRFDLQNPILDLLRFGTSLW